MFRLTSCTVETVAACSMFDSRRSESCFSEMIASGITASANEYTILLRACGIARDSQRAVFWMRRMQEAWVEADIFCMNALLSAYAADMDYEAADELLRAMEAGLQP
ncbi:unnamed protein product, partial [Effrenium voratum]